MPCRGVAWRQLSKLPPLPRAATVAPPPLLPLRTPILRRAVHPCAHPCCLRPLRFPQVYEAVFLISTRQFQRAAQLLLDAIATFTRWVGTPPLARLVPGGATVTFCLQAPEAAVLLPGLLPPACCGHPARCHARHLTCTLPPAPACARSACSGELMPYERCIFYTVVLAVVALDRPTLKSKVGEGPGLAGVVGPPRAWALRPPMPACCLGPRPRLVAHACIVSSSRPTHATLIY